MADDKIKLPRSSYEELCKIIKAYGRLAEAASLEQVAQLCAMNPTMISANNAFLSAIGIIEGGQKKSATIRGKELAQSLEHELPDVIQASWEHIVRGADFLMKMTTAVKIRGKMDSATLESHIAYSAGEAKSKPVMTGAKAVVDILRASGVVREEDGQLVSTELKPMSELKPIAEALGLPPETVIAAAAGHAAGRSIARAIGDTAVDAGVTLRIELRIDAKPSELDGLGEKIKNLLRELKKSEDGPKDS